MVNGNLRYTPGRGFNGTIEDGDGNLVATIHAWGTQDNIAYGLTFANAPRLRDALQWCADALEHIQPYIATYPDLAANASAACIEAGLALDAVRRIPPSAPIAGGNYSTGEPKP